LMEERKVNCDSGQHPNRVSLYVFRRMRGETKYLLCTTGFRTAARTESRLH
jgi:hypothetical protein